MGTTAEKKSLSSLRKTNSSRKETLPRTEKIDSSSSSDTSLIASAAKSTRSRSLHRGQSTGGKISLKDKRKTLSTSSLETSQNILSTPATSTPVRKFNRKQTSVGESKGASNADPKLTIGALDFSSIISTADTPVSGKLQCPPPFPP
ncbi:hypothetical protein TrVE_jg14380 [Triparma verrucosa]|uniref:Uncharacterized protein n=1 Tax=Triparma verrucosa TaxID=1606542 RepID=A0A9W7CIM2_9STRA|nr:hypothetical protein TrVE_jg14380 [Triparma verrucosa]